jgi:hypothetical protein
LPCHPSAALGGAGELALKRRDVSDQAGEQTRLLDELRPMNSQPGAVSPVGIFANATGDRFKLVGGIVNVGEELVGGFGL